MFPGCTLLWKKIGCILCSCLNFLVVDLERKEYKIYNTVTWSYTESGQVDGWVKPGKFPISEKSYLDLHLPHNFVMYPKNFRW